MNTLARNEINKIWSQVLAAISASLALTCYGLHYGWTSPFLPKLLSSDSLIPINSSEGSWISSMPLIGAGFGAILCAATINIVGRKKAILFISIPYIISWVIIYFAQSVWMLYIGRLIGGFSAGASFTVVPIYIGEVAEPRIRGLLGCNISIQWNLGILLVYSIGPYVSIQQMSMIGATLSIIFLLVFLWMPESPYYLCLKQKKDEAEKCLQYLRRNNNNSDEMTQICNTIDIQMQEKGSIKDMFVIKSNRRALFIVLVLTISQESSGRAAFSFYSETIFMQAGDQFSSSLCSIIYACTQMVASFISSFFVDKLGRRPLLLISSIGSAIALGIEGTYYHLKSIHPEFEEHSWISLFGLLLYIIIFMCGLGNIPMVMCSELFSVSVKPKCLCLVDLFAALTSAIVAKLFQITSDVYGIDASFWCFMCSCLFFSVFIFIFVPETKGKTLKEIHDYLKHSNFCSQMDDNIINTHL